MKENAYLATVLRAVKPLEGGYFYRNNTGTLPLQRKGKVRHISFGDVGSGDVIGCFLGRAVAIETKNLKGRQSDAQKAWQVKWEAAGGLYILPLKMRTPADAASFVLKALGVGPAHPRRPSGRVIHR